MKRLLPLILLLLGTILPSCEKKQSEPKKVVVMLDLHGSQGPLGKEAMNGFLLGWQLMEPSLSSQFYVSIIDTKTDMEATEKAAKISAPHVDIGAGFTNNHSIFIAGENFQTNRIPFLSIGATDPNLPHRFGNYIFLVPFGDNAQAAAAAEFAVKKFGKRAAVIWDSTSEYTRSLPKYFSTRFKQLDGEVLYNTSYPGGCQVNQIASNLALLKPEPDFIYLAAMPECAENIIISLREAGIELPIIGGDGMDTPAMTKDDSISDVWLTVHNWEGSERSQHFLEAYQNAFNSLPNSSFAALGFDTARLLGDVLQRSNGSNIMETLKKVTDFEGVTGTISYSKKIHVPQKTVWIIQINQGIKSLADHFIPSEVPPPLIKEAV